MSVLTRMPTPLPHEYLKACWKVVDVRGLAHKLALALVVHNKTHLERLLAPLHVGHVHGLRDCATVAAQHRARRRTDRNLQILGHRDLAREVRELKRSLVLESRHHDCRQPFRFRLLEVKEHLHPLAVKRSKCWPGRARVKVIEVFIPTIPISPVVAPVLAALSGLQNLVLRRDLQNRASVRPSTGTASAAAARLQPGVAR